MKIASCFEIHNVRMQIKKKKKLFIRLFLLSQLVDNK